MKASMLDSQLATLEAPDLAYRRSRSNLERAGSGSTGLDRDGEAEGDEGDWEKEVNVITVDLMMSTAEQVAAARKGLPGWLFDTDCDSEADDGR